MNVEQVNQYQNIAQEIIALEDVTRMLCEQLPHLPYEDSLVVLDTIKIKKRTLHSLRHARNEIEFVHREGQL